MAGDGAQGDGDSRDHEWVLTIDNGSWLLGQVRNIAGAADVQPVGNPLPQHRRVPAQQPRQFRLSRIALGPLLQLRLAPFVG